MRAVALDEFSQLRKMWIGALLTEKDGKLHLSEKIDSSGLNRRSVVKGAAWSVPVIAAAIAAPAASASHAPGHGKDLTPTFGGLATFNIRVGMPALVNANITLESVLTISNVGNEASAGDETVTVSYPGTLGSGVTLVSNSGAATVSLAPNGFVITLPAIPAGGFEMFSLGLVTLPVGIAGGTQTIVARVVADDANPLNNQDSTDVGITLLGNTGPSAG